MAKHIVLIRHGQSKGQVAGDRSNPILLDADLTPRGASQAKALCKAQCLNLAELVVVSPLTRALRTAQLMHLPVPMICWPGLAERGGIPENRGRPLSTILSENPDFETIDFSLIPLNWPSNRGSESDFRLNLFANWLLRRQEQHIVVVCHHNVIQKLLHRERRRRIENADPIPCVVDAERGFSLSSGRQPTGCARDHVTTSATPPRPPRCAVRIEFCERPEQKSASFVRVLYPSRNLLLRAAASKFKAVRAYRRKTMVIRRLGNGEEWNCAPGDDMDIKLELHDGDSVYIGPPLTPKCTEFAVLPVNATTEISSTAPPYSFNTGRSNGFVFFWRAGHPFSNFHPASFVLDGISYNCAEQAFMSAKARLFGDDATLAAILRAKTPQTQKRLGRKVRGFKDGAWLRAARAAMHRAVLAKFSQNEGLKQVLLSTEGRRIVEASPGDTRWGIGLRASDPRALKPSKWRGTNWLGEVLEAVRSELQVQSVDSATTRGIRTNYCSS